LPTWMIGAENSQTCRLERRRYAGLLSSGCRRRGNSRGLERRPIVRIGLVLNRRKPGHESRIHRTCRYIGTVADIRAWGRFGRRSCRRIVWRLIRKCGRFLTFGFYLWDIIWIRHDPEHRGYCEWHRWCAGRQRHQCEEPGYHRQQFGARWNAGFFKQPEQRRRQAWQYEYRRTAASIKLFSSAGTKVA
jgi:hypothetical protein